jgi:predicted ATPase
MTHDTITELRISGLRVIEHLTLPCRGTTVLIGDNGTGKSTILEALELLRQAATPINWIPDILDRAHGGLRSLLRQNSNELKLGISIEGAGPKLDYEFAIGLVGISSSVLSESANVYLPDPTAPQIPLLQRISTKTLYEETPDWEQMLQSSGSGSPRNWTEKPFGNYSLALPWLQSSTTMSWKTRILNALTKIEIHVPFETRPIWQQNELNIRTGPRWPIVIEQTDTLARYGSNLANAFHHLQNQGTEAVWKRVLHHAKWCLGDEFRNFKISSPNKGMIQLEVIFGTTPNTPLPIESLSEGQVSYLAFVAMVELNLERSILTIDEPELHLHPALLTRVVGMLEESAQSSPVILATHSDRLLDVLSEPEKSVVLCELNEHRALQIKRPDPAQLAQWLEDYRGLGSLRSEGYESYVFQNTSSKQEATKR